MANVMRFSLCRACSCLDPAHQIQDGASGKPLAHLALLLPADLWTQLTGVEDAANNPHVRSFLEMCMGVLQLGLLLALPIYRFGRQEKQS